MTRKDIHRPAEFDPENYRVVDYLDNKRPAPPDPRSGVYGNPRFMEMYEKAVAEWQRRIFEHFPDWRTGGDDHTSIHQCNHCGHPGIRWVAVVEHIPTGKKLAFGEICADRVELPGRDAFRAKFIKDRAARERKALENALADAEFDNTNPGLREWLFEHHEEHEFLGSLYHALNHNHGLSEAQVAAALKWQARETERQARRAKEREEMAAVDPLPEGRYLIEGQIVSHKWQDGFYGPQHKMLVRMDDGNKVWGTVPEAIENLCREDWEADGTPIPAVVPDRDYRGMRIRFTAQVERSRDDQHFGFFARPTKAELVSYTPSSNGKEGG